MKVDPAAVIVVRRVWLREELQATVTAPARIRQSTASETGLIDQRSVDDIEVLGSITAYHGRACGELL